MIRILVISNNWVHKQFSGIIGRLMPDCNFKCKRSRGESQTINNHPLSFGGLTLELVASFCYLGDCPWVADISWPQSHVARLHGKSFTSCCLCSQPTTSLSRPKVMCTTPMFACQSDTLDVWCIHWQSSQPATSQSRPEVICTTPMFAVPFCMPIRYTGCVVVPLMMRSGETSQEARLWRP